MTGFRRAPGRNGGNRFAEQEESCAAARTRLVMLLCGCSDTMLMGFTPDYLARTHRLHGNHDRNLREIEALLLARQDKRRREMAAA